MVNKQIKEPPSREGRIRAELGRLNRIFRNIPKNKRELAKGLIESAAFMRVTLTDMEKDLSANGVTEVFEQTLSVKPYDRHRPVATLYNTMNKNYQTTIKQLSELVVSCDNVGVSKLDVFNDEQ